MKDSGWLLYVSLSTAVQIFGGILSCGGFKCGFLGNCAKEFSTVGLLPFGLGRVVGL
jgi:hypothetical protein